MTVQNPNVKKLHFDLKTMSVLPLDQKYKFNPALSLDDYNRPIPEKETY